MTRDVAPVLGYLKPGLLHSKFFPSLQGIGKKMSASEDASAIFLTDTPAQITDKIKKHAYSGGQDSAEEHRRLGCKDINKDVPYQYLAFFLDDDVELKKIHDEYNTGKMLTGQVKARLSEVLIERVVRHQRARAMITEDVVDAFMTPRPLNLSPAFSR